MGAQLLANLQAAWFSFVELGCPKGGYNLEPFRLAPSPLQREVGQRLLRDARLFVRAGGGDLPALGRGRARLRELLNASSEAYGGPLRFDSRLENVSEDVDRARIAMPSAAGKVEPWRFLCPERAKVVRDLNLAR